MSEIRDAFARRAAQVGAGLDPEVGLIDLRRLSRRRRLATGALAMLVVAAGLGVGAAALGGGEPTVDTDFGSQPGGGAHPALLVGDQPIAGDGTGRSVRQDGASVLWEDDPGSGRFSAIVTEARLLDVDTTTNPARALVALDDRVVAVDRQGSMEEVTPRRGATAGALLGVRWAVGSPPTWSFGVDPGVTTCSDARLPLNAVDIVDGGFLAVSGGGPAPFPAELSVPRGGADDCWNVELPEAGHATHLDVAGRWAAVSYDDPESGAGWVVVDLDSGRVVDRGADRFARFVRESDGPAPQVSALPPGDPRSAIEPGCLAESGAEQVRLVATGSSTEIVSIDYAVAEDGCERWVVDFGEAGVPEIGAIVAEPGPNGRWRLRLADDHDPAGETGPIEGLLVATDGLAAQLVLLVDAGPTIASIDSGGRYLIIDHRDEPTDADPGPAIRLRGTAVVVRSAQVTDDGIEIDGYARGFESNVSVRVTTPAGDPVEATFSLADGEVRSGTEVGLPAGNGLWAELRLTVSGLVHGDHLLQFSGDAAASDLPTWDSIDFTIGAD